MVKYVLKAKKGNERWITVATSSKIDAISRMYGKTKPKMMKRKGWKYKLDTRR